MLKCVKITLYCKHYINLINKNMENKNLDNKNHYDFSTTSSGEEWDDYIGGSIQINENDIKGITPIISPGFTVHIDDDNRTWISEKKE